MHRCNCVRYLDIPLVYAKETLADDNELLILGCRPLMLRIAGTRLDITRGFHVGQ